MSAEVDRVDESIDLPALHDYFLGQGFAVAGELDAVKIAGGRSNLTFRVTDGVTTWVIRRPPVAGLTPSAHDVGREYRIVDALQGSGVPVARTLALCDDVAVIGAPFTVVGFVDGVVYQTQDQLAAVSDDDLGRIHRELIRVLVELHAVDYEAVGLGDYGRPAGYFQRQVKRWRQQWELVKIKDIPDVERLGQLLDGKVPHEQSPTIVHGDFRIDNTLLARDDLRVLALVDWELSTLGDPIADVATMCTYQHPDFDHVVGAPAASSSPRWPGVDAIANDYAAASGRDLSDFPLYQALAFFKLAVIAEGITARYLAGAGSGPGFATSTLAVPGLTAAGLAAMGQA
jgi:aminoglycoside phosphotransferase (APT) family kinase protein